MGPNPNLLWIPRGVCSQCFTSSPCQMFRETKLGPSTTKLHGRCGQDNGVRRKSHTDVGASIVCCVPKSRMCVGRASERRCPEFGVRDPVSHGSRCIVPSSSGRTKYTRIGWRKDNTDSDLVAVVCSSVSVEEGPPRRRSETV